MLSSLAAGQSVQKELLLDCKQDGCSNDGAAWQLNICEWKECTKSDFFIFIFTHAHSRGVGRFRSICNEPTALSSQSDWSVFIHRMGLYVLNCTGWPLTKTLSQRKVCQVDASVSVYVKNGSPFMDRMAVGFFHLLTPGLLSVRLNSETAYWRINVCLVALLFSCGFVCMCCCQSVLNLFICMCNVLISGDKLSLL